MGKKSPNREKIDYITVSLPLRLIEEIKDEILKMDEFEGRYTGHTDFIRETIRKRIQEIKALKDAIDDHVDNL